MRILFASAAAAAALALAAPASAQFVGQPGGVSIASIVGVHAFGIVEMQNMTARESFDAVLAESSGSTPLFAGVGVEVTRLWKGAFGRFTVTHAANDGSRVFVDSTGEAHSLNVPVRIALTPIEIGGGWRFGGAAVSPYVGAGVVLQRYRETSRFAEASEQVKAIDGGSAIFGGVTIAAGVGRIGLEGVYRRVPITPGGASVLEQFAQTDLGGAGVRVTFGVEF